MSVNMSSYERKVKALAADLEDYSKQRITQSKGKSFDIAAMISKAEDILGTDHEAIMSIKNDVTIDTVREIASALWSSRKDKSLLYRRFMEVEDTFQDEDDINYDVSHLIEETQARAEQASKIVSDAVERTGLDITVVIEPMVSSDGLPDEGSNVFNIDFGQDIGFTLFLSSSGDIDIDDVMEGGDEFADPMVQAKYFQLINEIRKPGSTSKSKRIKLYTARPKADRDRFAEATTLPLNLFLSSSESDAEGIAADGDRDLYVVITDIAYLVQTLDTPSVKHYQVVKSDAPIYKIDRLT